MAEPSAPTTRHQTDRRVRASAHSAAFIPSRPEPVPARTADVRAAARTFHGEVEVREAEVSREVLVPARHREAVRGQRREPRHRRLVAPEVRRRHHQRPQRGAAAIDRLVPDLKGHGRRRPVPREGCRGQRRRRGKKIFQHAGRACAPGGGGGLGVTPGPGIFPDAGGWRCSGTACRSWTPGRRPRPQDTNRQEGLGEQCAAG